MTRILFVDDDQSILDGLRRTLRPMRTKWEMCFVNGGDLALEQLSAQSFDVLVTDMQMPGMDGYNLLKAVFHHHPTVKRVVLSGQSQLESAVRVEKLAHSYLAKPCFPQQLTETIETLHCTSS